MKINTVLCPIDFSPLTDRELELAVEVCRSFGARLVLHHNLAAAAPGMSKAWEWEGAHLNRGMSETEAERRMAELMAKIPSNVKTEARISRGPVALLLLYLVEELHADLVILGSHGWSSEEHASVAERLLDRCPCPILSIQEGKSEGRTFRLHESPHGQPPRVVVATDFSPEAHRALSYAFELARTVPVELHLVHVATSRAVPAAAAGYGVPNLAEDSLEELHRKLRELVPSDLEGQVQCHVESGKAAEGLLHSLQSLDPELLVMGQHARGFLRRLFTRDTSREMLHKASCAVWFVPELQAA